MNDQFSFQHERRQDPTSQAVVLLMKDLQKSVEHITTQVTALDRSVTYYRATQDEAIEKAITKAVERAMHNAFPEGDAEGHRRHHEAVIKAAEERAALWKDARSSVAKWGAVGLVGWLLHLAWIGVLAGPKT